MQISNIINESKIYAFKRKRILFVFGLLLIICISINIYLNTSRDADLEVIYLDIGQGDAILIKDPKGINLLIDTGAGSITTQKVQKELSVTNKNMDGVLITHPDSDHAGGFDELSARFNVKNTFISSEDDYSKQVKDNILNVSSVNNLNQIRLSDSILLNIISPEKGMLSDGNAKSIVNTMLYGNFNFIFTGDADSETERKLVSQGYFDKNQNKKIINILKVGHHGSDTSSSELFLKKVKPEYCIISVGRDNKYGHPTKNVLDRLEKHCKNIFRTDLSGNASFKTDGKLLKIKTEK